MILIADYNLVGWNLVIKRLALQVLCFMLFISLLLVEEVYIEEGHAFHRHHEQGLLSFYLQLTANLLYDPVCKGVKAGNFIDSWPAQILANNK